VPTWWQGGKAFQALSEKKELNGVQLDILLNGQQGTEPDKRRGLEGPGRKGRKLSNLEGLLLVLQHGGKILKRKLLEKGREEEKSAWTLLDWRPVKTYFEARQKKRNETGSSKPPT